MDKTRRTLLQAALACAPAVLAARPALAADLGASATLPVWPGNAPGGSGPGGAERVNRKGSLTNIAQARLQVYRPARPNGSAALVIAGGGYAHIQAGTESTPACRWLQSLGVTAFELIYRLPGEGWSNLAPFQDGQRALRLIRANAAAYGLDPRRIGVLGFSAGAHLGGSLATQPDLSYYDAIDEIDRVAARPDFAALIYPVLTFMPPFDQTHARREIVGDTPDAAQSAAFSVERHVDAHTPPTFLAQACDDPISPVDNSLLMFNALRAAGIQVEMHLFEAGGHGWGMGAPGSLVQAWPQLFSAWSTRHGWTG